MQCPGLLISQPVRAKRSNRRDCQNTLNPQEPSFPSRQHSVNPSVVLRITVKCNPPLPNSRHTGTSAASPPHVGPPEGAQSNDKTKKFFWSPNNPPVGLKTLTARAVFRFAYGDQTLSQATSPCTKPHDDNQRLHWQWIRICDNVSKASADRCVRRHQP